MHWFDKLSADDKVDVLAFHRLRQAKRAQPSPDTDATAPARLPGWMQTALDRAGRGNVSTTGSP